MKKLFYIFIVSSLIHQVSQAQVAYYDVMSVKKLLVKKSDGSYQFKNDSASKPALAAVLRNYTKPAVRTNKNSTISTVVGEFKNNPILGRYVKDIVDNGEQGTAAGSQVLAGIGNMDVSALADGLAQALADKAKEELSVAFFQRFEAFLNNYPEIKVLFPNTASLLENFKFWEYTNVLNTLREAFDKDLKQLLKHTADLGDLDPALNCAFDAKDTAALASYYRNHNDAYNGYLHLKYLSMSKDTATSGTAIRAIKKLTANDADLKNLDAKFTTANSKCGKLECVNRLILLKGFLYEDEARYLMAALKIADGAISGQKVPDIIHAVADKKLLGGLNNTAPAQQDLRVLYRFTDILSYSLRSNDKSRNYITAAQLEALFADSTARTIYLGLLYQQVKNENLTLNVNGVAINLATEVQQFSADVQIAANARVYLDSLIVKGDRFHTDVVAVSKAQKSDTKDLPTALGNMFVDFQDLLDHATNLTSIDQQIVLPPLVNDITALTNSTLTISHDVAIRNYNAAVFGLLNTLQQTVDVICKNNPTSCNSKPVTLMTNMLKYGSFAANIVTCKSSEEVKKAIAAAAMPSGSSSIKKHSTFSIDLQAYVGLTGGKNYWINKQSQVISYTVDTSFHTGTRFKSDTSTKTNPKSTLISIHAPIGFSFSWGLRPGGRHPGSISLFVPIIDLGALVGFRLNDSTSKIESDNIKIRLSNIFAPGGGIAIGIPDVPISLTGYWEWIPTLQRDNTSNSLQFYDQTGFRVGASLVVDLPMFNLYTSKDVQKRIN